MFISIQIYIYWLAQHAYIVKNIVDSEAIC